MTPEELFAVLPHRYPFILVDRILEAEGGSYALGLKNVSLSDPVFQGHFPGHPIFPGVLLIEAMAQVGAVALLTSPEDRGKLGLLAGVSDARFREPVLPGDTLLIRTDIEKRKGDIGKGHGRVTCEGRLVAEADILFALKTP